MDEVSRHPRGPSAMRYRRACLLSLVLCRETAGVGDKFRPVPAVAKAKPGSVRVLFFRDAAPAEVSPAAELPTGKKVYALADLPLVLTEPCAVTTGGLTFRVEQERRYRFCNLRTTGTATVPRPPRPPGRPAP